MRLRLPLLLSLLLALTLGDSLDAQRPGGRRGGGNQNGQDAEKGGPKPYDEVVTEDFETDPGLFLVHRDGETVLYEVPREALGEDMLWVTQIARTQAGFGYGGTPVGNRVVRWELRGEQVLLRDIKFTIRNADEEDPLRHSVEATSIAPIIETFPVKAWGKDQRPVIDVSGLFKDDLQEFSAKRRLNASGADEDRSYFEGIKSFPENIETRVLMTYRLSGGGDSGGRRFPRGGSRRDPTQGAVTVELHHSMVALPAEPMEPRIYDDRVGFFTVSYQEYDGVGHEVETERSITRWRLEKKDPDAEASEPVEPIVFHVGRGVPEKWRPWVRKGIEMWQPAFEAAGFKNAILAKDAPTEQEDPDWDAEDARYSSIRWLPSTTENAMGPHVHDPRTGEILEADILVFHNVLKLVRDWYFIQASPNDPEAQELPLPDETIGEALAYVIAHEVGHSLGFPHNMKASSSYTVEQLRDPEFTAKNGTEASIMDYGRFNYVAQPGDGARLIPTIGPYDYFAIEWGYRQYAIAEDEEAGQRALLARQIDDPMLRFGNPNPSEDPTQQTEDLGSDAIEATRLGLLNLDRVASYLVGACCEEGEDYDLLENMYGELVGQRNRELMHVANLVGGVERRNLRFGDADRVFHPLERTRQEQAIAFLHAHAFQTPDALVQEDILHRIEASGVSERVLASQKRLLATLIQEERTRRMAEHAELLNDPSAAYTPYQMLGDLRAGIWSELDEIPVAIDLYRRNLQRAHAELLIEQIGTEMPESDLPALARGELVQLLHGIGELTSFPDTQRLADAETRLHLADLRERIQGALDPERTLPAPATTSAQGSPR